MLNVTFFELPTAQCCRLPAESAERGALLPAQAIAAPPRIDGAPCWLASVCNIGQCSSASDRILSMR